MKKIYIAIFLLLCLFVTDVYASNDVDYKLTITDDFKFIEEINYSISNYKKITNGDNYFNRIVDDNIYTDIFYKTKYAKTKKKENGKYLVTLKHTYNEYTFSNSLLLNNCFESSKYNYDVNKYSYKGSGGFNCLYGDNLKITIVSNFESTSNNAIVSENSYTWNPTDSNFIMNISFNKKYEQKNANGPTDYADTKQIDDSGELTNQDDAEQVKSHINKYVVLVIVGVLLISGFVVIIVLKNKNNNLNKI